MALTMGEEGFANAQTAILGKQDGLAEIADGTDVVATLEERVLKLGTFVTQGEAGGGADNVVTSGRNPFSSSASKDDEGTVPYVRYQQDL